MSQSKDQVKEIIDWIDGEITPVQAQNSLNKHFLNYAHSLEEKIERLERVLGLPPLEKIPVPVDEGKEGP